MEKYFRNLNLLEILMKWKMHLGIIALVAIVLSFIFSGPAFIKPRFKSTAILYPSNIKEYSDESLTEQMLQIMQSTDIRDSLILKFELIEHYKIDTTKKYWKSALYWTYSRNVKIGKTPYEAVQIDVYDTDPYLACDMVNAIIKYYDRKIANLHNTKFGEVVSMYERYLNRKSRELDSLQNRMRYLSTNYGLLEYEYQTQQVMKGVLGTLDGNGRVNRSEAERLRKNMEMYGGEMVMLQELIKQEAANYALIKKDYDRAWMDHDRRFTYSNIINHPKVADKKSTPIRWVIVLISTLSTLFLSVLVIGIIENSRPATPKL